MTHPIDTGTHWPEDAALFERVFGPDWDEDDHRPTRAELDRDEYDDAEAEREYLDHAEDSAWLESRDGGWVSTGRAVAVVLFCCIVLPLLFLAFYVGGNKIVCWANGDATRQCPSYPAVSR